MNPTQLIEQAKLARSRAYAPYSQFQVGAALLCKDGRVFHGCNVENAAYGLCHCAERTAFMSAIAAGQSPHQFAAMAIIADTQEPICPCGSCRQVIVELAGIDLPIYMSNLQQQIRQASSGELLPFAFLPDHLNHIQNQS